ncbi:MAG TPA: protein kinase [Thermoanaerobaculia bacterium]|nr:protein kinase [Thermoanaerobaculia bacterium]
MTLAAGTRLGPYEITGVLGSGGMGEVYRAKDPRLGRDVAIKVLPASFSSDFDRLRRFEQEARAVSALSHPNILTIHDIGQHDGAPYVVTELLEGETLRSVLAGGGLSTRKANNYALQIAHGLGAAHEKGIVHRDLKPENLFVTRDDRVKILDFGIAKLTQPAFPLTAETDAPTAAPQTQSGVILGTVAYMSPEQILGKPVDARSDLFSLGVVLYEMLSGERPFQKDTAPETMTAILKEDPLDRPGSERDFPFEVRRVLAHCLEKNPGERFQSARDLAFDLRTIGTGTETPKPSAVSAAVPRRPARFWIPVAGIGAAALLAALLVFNVGGIRDRRPWARGTRIDTLAVLPLANLSGDPEQDYFADGMTEAVITDLAKIKAMKVISRTSVMPYRNSKKSMREIASELKAAAVIEGSVMRSADRVRITVQLIDASSDQHLWAESYERDLKNVFALQGEVAQAIAQRVRAVMTPQEQARLVQKRPVDPEVYELYLRGRHIMMRGGLEDVRKAIEYFQSGLAKDPKNALIYTGLADAYIEKMSDVHESPVEATAKARAAAMKALELDESLAEAHTSLGSIKLFYDWDWTGGEKELRRAIELDPGYSEAYRMYGAYLTMVGRQPEAVPYFEKAHKLNPLYPVGGYSYFMGHKYDEAIEQYRKSLEVEPGAMMYFGLVLALAEKGDYATAISEGEKATKLNDSPLLMTSLASAYARAGRRADSDHVLRQLEEISKHQGPAPAWHVGLNGYVCPYEVAGVYAQLGDKDRAFEWLDKAYQNRSCMYWLRVDPRLESIHTDPRFQELLAKMRFPPQ